MSEERFKLRIDREVWARGGRSANCLLSRSQDFGGKRRQCCVGIYLSALGVPDDVLRGHGAADEFGVNQMLPESALWLGQGMCRTDSAQRLYTVNDRSVGLPIRYSEDPILESEEHRERLVADEFALHGVDVEFVGGGA